MNAYLFNNPSLCVEALSCDEMFAIDGGGFAYDVGHFLGSVAHDIIVAVFISLL